MAIMAAATIGSSLIQGSQAAGAARSAASTQERAQMAGIEEQRRQFDIGREEMAPFREVERETLGERRALMGLLGPEAQQEAMMRQEQTARMGQETATRLAFESPAEKFARERAEQAIMRQASATGGLGGARVQEALQQQAIGFAQQDISQASQSLQQQLQGLNMGMSATRAGVQAGQQFGQAYATGMGNVGQAQAGGILGAARAQNQAIGGITRGIGQAYGYF